MKLDELKKKISAYKIPDRWYSINDGLKPDACILFKNYSHWEYFYLEERGDRRDFKIFTNEEDAYEHLWEKLLYVHNFFIR